MNPKRYDEHAVHSVIEVDLMKNFANKHVLLAGRIKNITKTGYVVIANHGKTCVARFMTKKDDKKLNHFKKGDQVEARGMARSSRFLELHNLCKILLIARNSPRRHQNIGNEVDEFQEDGMDEIIGNLPLCPMEGNPQSNEAPVAAKSKDTDGRGPSSGLAKGCTIS